MVYSASKVILFAVLWVLVVVLIGIVILVAMHLNPYKGEYFAIGPRAAETAICHVYDVKQPPRPCNTYPSPIVACKTLRDWTASRCAYRLKEDNTGVNTPVPGQVFFLSP